MSRYPVLYAGQRITADGVLTAMQQQFVLKVSNEDRASTTTLTADTDLQIALEANAVYQVEMFIHYAANGGGFQTEWSTPSGATGNRWCLGEGSTQVSADNVSGRWGVHNFTGTLIKYGDRASSTNLSGALEQGIVTTSSAGTLALTWAQTSSNAANTRVGAASFMRVTRLA